MNKYCVDKIINEMNSCQKNINRWDKKIDALIFARHETHPGSGDPIDMLEQKIIKEENYMNGIRFSAHLLGLDLIRSDVTGMWFVPRDLYSTLN